MNNSSKLKLNYLGLIFYFFLLAFNASSQVPNAQFSASILTANVGVSINFTNLSTYGTATIISSHWNFGDGTNSNLSNPSHIYLLPGTYPVSLTFTTSGGTDVETKLNYITILPVLNAAFGAVDSSGCSPLTVQFMDLSFNPNSVGNPIVSWFWTFGDGGTFNGQTPPPHTYNLGKYNVSLVITTQNGTTKTINSPNFIKVGSIDHIDFSLTPTIGCAKKNYFFTDQSVFNGVYDSTDFVYYWDFGDGDSSNKQNPIYNYPRDTGYFNIHLHVNYRGCEDSLKKYSLVYIKAPISNFSVQKLICNPVSFPVHVPVHDYSKAGKLTDNVTMKWKWGIPGDPDDNLTIPDMFDANKGDTGHYFPAYGTYVVQQVIHNYTTGCADSTAKTVTISKMEPSFTLSNDTICLGSPITVTSTSLYTDPVPFFSFNMGNTVVVNGNPINYTYPNSGIVNITLKATNAAGCVKSTVYNNVVILPNPIAEITSSDSVGCISSTSIFSNGSHPSTNGVPLKNFTWTFPNGTSQITTDTSITTTYTYTNTGSFHTTLKATDIFGCVSKLDTTFNLITKPIADFTTDSIVCNLETISNLNLSTGSGNLVYSWKVDTIFQSNNLDFSTAFNDTSSNLYSNVAHIISLITTDENACSDSISKTIHVSLPRANIGFNALGSTPNGQGQYLCPPIFETFTDQSISYGNITSWLWNFENGDTSILQNPNNSYAFPGSYTASLSIIDEFGCKADTTIIDYLTILGPSGNPNWNIVGDTCLHQFSFAVSNPNFVDSIVWNLNDGTILYDSLSLLHTYFQGTFDPSVKLIDSLGCEVNYQLPTIFIAPLSISANAGSDQNICTSTTNLNAILPTLGTGIWTKILGNATIVSPNSPTSSVINLSIDSNIFVWTVTHNCEIISDTVIVINGTTNSYAGSDQNSCISSPISLNGSLVQVGTGTWSLVSGTGTITNPLLPNTTVTGLGIGTTEFVWENTSFCSVSRDTVKITIETFPTIPNAGINDTICGNSIILNGNPILIGNGNWTVTNGLGIISNNQISNPNVTNISVGNNVFKWTISNTCGSNSDSVQIFRYENPTLAKTIKNNPICSTHTNIEANNAVIGTGIWSVMNGSGIIGNSLDSTTTISNLSVGKNLIKWTISNFCATSSDSILIIVETTPTASKVGGDTTICGNFAILDGNLPISGIGEWSFISGSGSINEPNDPTSGVQNLATGINVLKWTISNSCGIAPIDQLTITNRGQCPDEDSINKVLLYFIPNSFTPNGDVFNQTFQPVFTSGFDPQNYSFYVYNKWGEIIFESHDASIGWKGTLGSDDRMVQDGVYRWKVVFTDKMTQKEHRDDGVIILAR